jgi:Na+-transporting NADH:ubiquinone oxidoreductase subunit NqrB
MLSAMLMYARVRKAVQYAVREEDFLNVAGAGAFLVFLGTLTYALGASWNVVDAFYFTVSLLTTTSVADPDLVIDDRWLKVYTVLFQLVGIGILVEVLRRLGSAFVTVRKQEKAEKSSE